MRKTKMLLASILLVLMVNCGGLPADFASLSLDAKIKAYERHFRLGGRSRIRGELWISWHGKPAAEMMIPYILGKKKGIPRGDAIQIVWDVQLRGCSLRGTEAEKVLEEFIKSNKPSDPDYQLAEYTLDSIRSDSHMAGRFDSLPPGPCNKRKGTQRSTPVPGREDQDES
jgi:hypothetical protein